ncbi:ABC transporter ATP-binding protein [Rathayibacter sp. VKM Ac-2801]|uniref:ABC transporter ATP-binding protein n=1 Tax=Rathayibacter sp. VKM Ac-2801 TaxID=2609255 RepID=UPI00132040EB|nr:ABC transporter ATP-binding protein [Rathayibacter sp. VKM Ac-2801]QHC70761.1 ATP-binding cassette domain-containing protein [Rathayibacter sp. VKM Ac-2801]
MSGAAVGSASGPSMREQGAALWRLLTPVHGQLLIAVLVQVVAAVASVVPFIAVASLAIEVLENGISRPGELWRWGWAAAGALVVRALATLVAGAITHYADNDLQLILRRRIAARLERAPLGWFTQRSAGAVKKGVADDVAAMHHLVSHAELELTNAIVVPVVTLIYLFSVSWGLALLVLVPMVVGFWLYGRQLKAGAGKMEEYSVSMERVTSAGIEFMQGISVVKTFGQTGRAHRRFLDATTAFIDFFWGMVMGTRKTTAAADVVLAPLASLVVVIAGGAMSAQVGWIDPVDIIPFALLGLGLTGPLFAMWYALTSMQQAQSAAVRVQELLDTPVLDEPDVSAIPDGERVELRGVTFSYDGEHDALRGIDLTLTPGTTTALVGRSGSGKTTISRLIPRFWDLSSGQILLGGKDLRMLSTEELFRHVSFVFQDVQLLRTSVLDNIRMARADATLEQVHAAARSAQIHARILELPRGYDSVIGEDALLSGGEAQRVSIARAILADTPVLVLDEATAFADPESEALIQDALSELTAGRTLLVIAHRLSTIEHADQIVVLDSGRIAERGTHPDLLAAGGIYAQLWADHERSASWAPRRAAATGISSSTKEADG